MGGRCPDPNTPFRHVHRASSMGKIDYPICFPSYNEAQAKQKPGEIEMRPPSQDNRAQVTSPRKISRSALPLLAICAGDRLARMRPRLSRDLARALLLARSVSRCALLAAIPKDDPILLDFVEIVKGSRTKAAMRSCADLGIVDLLDDRS